MDSEDDIKQLSKVKTLKGAENFTQWRISITAALVGKDLIDYLDSDRSAPSTPSEIKADKKGKAKAWSIIIQSLSDVVIANLPPSVTNYASPSASALWDAISAQYSASVGTQKAILFQQMWTHHLGEGEDPGPHLARIRSAHAQIQASKADPDQTLAYAFTMTLPESFSTLQQSLWAKSNLSSVDAANAIMAEWSRRTASNKPSGLLARSKFAQTCIKRGGNTKTPTKHCKVHGNCFHDDAHCFQQGAARPASQPLKAEANVTTVNYPIDFEEAQAFIHSTSVLAKSQNLAKTNDSVKFDQFASVSLAAGQICVSDMFVIDSGASRHMVTSASPLTNIHIVPPVQITVGNGQKLVARQAGTIQFGDFALRSVLLVPGISHNLISVSATPSNCKWEFSKHSASLYSARGSLIIAGQLENGLYTFKTHTNDLVI